VIVLVLLLVCCCSPKHFVYYKRELLCRSLDGHRVDLITVSDCRGMSDTEEPRFDSRLFPDTATPRCRMFAGKKACYDAALVFAVAAVSQALSVA